MNRPSTHAELVRSAAADVAAIEVGEPIELAIEVDAPLPSTLFLELPPLADPDQLTHTPPGPPALTRPSSLTPLYVTFAALQAADLVTTIKALQNPTLREANPLVRPFAGNVPAMVILKGTSTAVTVFAVERLWRRNRAAAVATMVGINAAYGIIVSRNAALQ